MAEQMEGAPEPLSEQTFLLLLSLADGPLHGYAIMSRVSELSGGRVRLGTGTLYGGVKRLLAAGWIRRVGGVEGRAATAEPPRTRKCYELTEFGRRMLGSETSRLRALVKAASRVHGVDAAGLSPSRVQA